MKDTKKPTDCGEKDFAGKRGLHLTERGTYKVNTKRLAGLEGVMGSGMFSGDREQAGYTY